MWGLCYYVRKGGGGGGKKRYNVFGKAEKGRNKNRHEMG